MNSEITLKKSKLILLVLDFLKSEGYDKTLVSLELETGISLYSYPKEIVYLRNLILEGQWASSEELLSPMEEVLSNEKFLQCLFEIRKQKFLELIESDKSQVEELVQMLKDLNGLSVNRSDFQKLVTCISSDSLIDTPEYAGWTILGGRVKCFEIIREILEDVFPSSKSERKIAANSFVNMLGYHLDTDLSFLDQSATLQRKVEIIDDLHEKEDKKQNSDLGERILRNEKLSQSLNDKNLRGMLATSKDSAIKFMAKNNNSMQAKANQVSEGMTKDVFVSTKSSNINRMSLVNDDKFDINLENDDFNFNDRVLEDTQQEEELKNQDPSRSNNDYFPIDNNKLLMNNTGTIIYGKDEDEEYHNKDLINDFIDENDLGNNNEDDLADLDKEEYFLKSNYELFNYNILNFYERASIKDLRPIRTSCFSPNKGDFLAIGTNSCSIKIFDIRALTYAYNINSYKYNDLFAQKNVQLVNKEIRQLKEIEKHHTGSIYCIDWSCSGKLIASGSNDQLVKCMVVPDLECGDEEEKLELAMVGHKGIVRCVSFDPTEELILLSCGQKESHIKVWDPEEGRIKSLLEGHSSDVNIIRWSNDNQLCVSGGEDRTLRFWDFRTNKSTHMISGLKYDIINDVAVYTRNKSVRNYFFNDTR